MNGKWKLPGVLLATLLVTVPATAQYDPTSSSSNPLLNQYGAPYQQPLGKGLESPPAPAPPSPPVSSLSPYILGATSHPDGCCGPVGGYGPISWEIYARTGTAISFGNSFSADLNLGWTVQGGARTLFYNVEQDGAWVLDIGLTNIYQNAGGRHTYTLVDFPEVRNNQRVLTPVKELTGDYLNRTLFGLSIGREVWLLGNARVGQNGCGMCESGCGPGCVDGAWNLRIGWDFGGRWGTTKFMPNEARHLNERLGGVFVAVHSDIEIPCGGCIFQSGVRMEWGYTWNDVVQSRNPADIQDLLFLWNMGIRF